MRVVGEGTEEDEGGGGGAVSQDGVGIGWSQRCRYPSAVAAGACEDDSTKQQLRRDMEQLQREQLRREQLRRDMEQLQREQLQREQLRREQHQREQLQREQQQREEEERKQRLQRQAMDDEYAPPRCALECSNFFQNLSFKLAPN